MSEHDEHIALLERLTGWEWEECHPGHDIREYAANGWQVGYELSHETPQAAVYPCGCLGDNPDSWQMRGGMGAVCVWVDGHDTIPDTVRAFYAALAERCTEVERQARKVRETLETELLPRLEGGEQ